MPQPLGDQLGAFPLVAPVQDDRQHERSKAATACSARSSASQSANQSATGRTSHRAVSRSPGGRQWASSASTGRLPRMPSVCSTQRAPSGGAARCRTRPQGLAELVRRLRQCGEPETVQVAIERRSGVVIDTLMNAGIQDVAIHENVVKASGARDSAARAKSDDGDSYLLADLLRTDGHRLSALEPLADDTGASQASRRRTTPPRRPAGGARQSAARTARALLARRRRDLRRRGFQDRLGLPGALSDAAKR